MDINSLFQGTTPPGTTTYNQNLNQIPSWLLNSSNSLIAQANSLAGQPYQQFPGPRVAPWTPDQYGAQGIVEGMQGQYQPTLSAAQSLIGGSTNAAPFNNAYGLLPQAQGAIQGAMAPTAATMNPYTSNVIQKAEDVASQYWNNTLQPSINQQYTAAGQPLSSANARALGQNAAQINQNIQDTSQAALSGAFQNAQNVGLQGAQGLGTLAQLGGGLGYEQGILGLQGAQGMGSLAQLGQNLGLQGAGTLYNLGQAQQQQGQQNLNTAYDDWHNQTYYPQNQLSWLSNMIKGTATPATTGSATSGTNAGYLPGAQYGPSPINQAIGVYTGQQGMTGNPYSQG